MYRHVIRYEMRPGTQGLTKIGVVGRAWTAESGCLTIELSAGQAVEEGVFYTIGLIDHVSSVDPLPSGMTI